MCGSDCIPIWGKKSSINHVIHKNAFQMIHDLSKKQKQTKLKYKYIKKT